MDWKQFDGISRQVKGVMKQYLGKIVGDAKLTSDGSIDRAAGEAQYASSPDNLGGIDVDRIKGVAHQLKGALKEGLGTMTGDARLLADGIAERDAGKIQNAAGSARDEARDPLRHGQPEADTRDPSSRQNPSGEPPVSRSPAP